MAYLQLNSSTKLWQLQIKTLEGPTSASCPKPYYAWRKRSVLAPSSGTMDGVADFGSGQQIQVA